MKTASGSVRRVVLLMARSICYVDEIEFNTYMSHEHGSISYVIVME